jgi:hypothetical protein
LEAGVSHLFAKKVGLMPRHLHTNATSNLSIIMNQTLFLKEMGCF